MPITTYPIQGILNQSDGILNNILSGKVKLRKFDPSKIDVDLLYKAIVNRDMIPMDGVDGGLGEDDPMGQTNNTTN